MVALGRFCIAAIVVATARIRSKKLVWTVHNLTDHEAYHTSLEAVFMAFFVRNLDLSIYLSELGQKTAFARFPALTRRVSVVIPHPHYGELGAAPMARVEAVDELKLGARSIVILAFGMVRRYKNLPELMKVFSQLPDNNLRLVIAGHALDGDLAHEIRRLASDSRIVLALEKVPDADLEVYFAAATLVVAPYRAILNSGAAFMSLSHARPILLPDQGALPELQRKVGSEWVRLYTPPLTVEKLQTAIEWAAALRLGQPDLAAFHPDAVVAAHDLAFRQLSSSFSRRRR